MMHYIQMVVAGVGLVVALSNMSLAQDCHVFPLPCGGTDCTWDPSKSAMQNINDARATENLPALSLPTAYPTAPGDQKIIMLINAERKSRGLYALNNGTDRNDPLIGYMAYNHSKLLADIPTIGNDGPHDNAVDGTLGDRIASMPGHEAFGSSGEIITGQNDPEMAMWSWMYTDAGQSWGHRNGILGCKIKFAGAGVAPTINGRTNYTVDFIDDPDNSYKMLPPGTPKPSPLSMSVEAKYILVNDHISAQVHIDVGYVPLEESFPNYYKWAYIWSPASWGKPVGTVPILGRPPVGLGGTECVWNNPSAVGSMGAGPGAVFYSHASVSCDVVVPVNGFLTITVVDRYSNTTILYECDAHGAIVAGEVCFDIKSDPGIPTAETQKQ